MNDLSLKVRTCHRCGFTLVELLVVVAILGILGTVAVKYVIGHVDNSRRTAAMTAVGNVSGAVTRYMLDKHISKPPSDLSVLIESDECHDPVLDGGESSLRDPWGNEYRIEVKGRRFAIVSNGPDGEPDTMDDVRSDSANKATKPERNGDSGIKVYSNVDGLKDGGKKVTPEYR